MKPFKKEGEIIMILADKIMDLRKKSAWSQEELAEKLGVSRQSISKWEGAQSVPDLTRIVQMSELFGVSTDYLLRDELESIVPAEGEEKRDSAAALRTVTMEEANAFLAVREENAQSIALGVLLCVLSPLPVMLLVGTEWYARLSLAENQAIGISMVLLFALIGSAVALFVTSGLRGKRFECLREEPIETLYGVDGMVRERMERFRPTFTMYLTLGIVLCVLSVLPIFVCLFLFGEEAEAAMVVGAACLIAMVAAGAMLIVSCAIRYSGYRILLEEGDYTRAEKAQAKRFGPVISAYWLIVTAAYLAVSFLTNAWDRTWIIWPVAGVANGAVCGIMRILRREEQ